MSSKVQHNLVEAVLLIKRSIINISLYSSEKAKGLMISLEKGLCCKNKENHKY